MNERRGQGNLPGFSLIELLTVISIIAILAALLLGGVSMAKRRAISSKCQSNLRQIGIGMHMYVTDNKIFPGGVYVGRDEGKQDYYTWVPRLLDQVGDRAVFYCPAAPRDSAWDTNVNMTLGATLEDGSFDPFGVKDVSRFSIGYNDWGVGQGQIMSKETPQLGLGGDVHGPFYKGPIADTDVTDVSAMIMFGDAKADGSWDGSLDPTEEGQWPSNRHSGRTNLQFVDGHIENAKRGDIIDPRASNPWRRRWNIDNDSHDEISWSVNWVVEGKIEK